MKQIASKQAIGKFFVLHSVGFLIILAAIALMFLICITVFRNGYSASDDLNQDFVYGIFAAYSWKCIA